MMNVLLLAIGALLAIGGNQVGAATNCTYYSTILQDCEQQVRVQVQDTCSRHKLIGCCVGKAAKTCPATTLQWIVALYNIRGAGQTTPVENIKDLCSFNITERFINPDSKTCTEPPAECTSSTPLAVVVTCAQKNSINLNATSDWACQNVKPFYCCVAAGMAKCTSQHPAIVQMLTAAQKPPGTKTIDEMYNEKCKIKGTEVLKKPSDTCAPPSTSSFVTSSCLLMITSVLLAYF